MTEAKSGQILTKARRGLGYLKSETKSNNDDVEENGGKQKQDQTLI